MKFGSARPDGAEGAILAHSLHLHDGRIRKGRVLSKADIERLVGAGIERVVVARLEGNDLPEDKAAELIAQALVADCKLLTASAPFAGRSNLIAQAPGLLQVDSDRLTALNLIDPAITLATLANNSRVIGRALVGTLKIITYGVDQACVARAVGAAGGVIAVRPVILRTASLIVTEVVGSSSRASKKGMISVASRLDALGIRLVEVARVRHDMPDICHAIRNCIGELIMLMTGSATSDPEDVGPQAVREAGGSVARFGIPVDPGNLLFFGALGQRPVIGLPGCAKSPALNGADWVLERLACGLELGDRDIAQMGAGGLLKEIPIRPQPRRSTRLVATRPRVTAAVLVGVDTNAAIQTVSFLRECAVDQLMVISQCSAPDEASKTRPGSTKIVWHALSLGADYSQHVAAAATRLSGQTDSVLLVRAGDEAVGRARIDTLVSAFSPADGREICCLATPEGRREFPVLMGRRYFETLADATTGKGVAEIVANAGEYVVDIEL